MNNQEILERSFIEYPKWPDEDQEVMIVSNENNNCWGEGKVGFMESELDAKSLSTWDIVATKQEWLAAKEAYDTKKEKAPKIGKEYLLLNDQLYNIEYGHDVIGKNVLLHIVSKSASGTDIATVEFNGEFYCFRLDMLHPAKPKEEVDREELEDKFYNDLELWIDLLDLEVKGKENAKNLARHMIGEGWVLNKKEEVKK